jgi:intermembrane space import and assembly protein 40
MSYCKQEGKDKIIFVTKEDHEKPSTVQLKDDEESQPGLILPGGEINWNCPCLGGMATGPCGVEFREAFSCFHFSENEPKGVECFDKFSTMQKCMTQYPSLYGKYNEPDDDDEEEILGVQEDDDEQEGEAKRITDEPVNEMAANMKALSVKADSSKN